MIFYMVFKKKINRKIVVELKNGLIVTGTLLSCDVFMNLKLNNIRIHDIKHFRGLEEISSLSLRGSSVKSIKLQKDENLIASLLEASRNRFIVNEMKEETNR